MCISSERFGQQQKLVFFGKETVYANKRATDAVIAIATEKTIEAKAADTAKAAAAALPPPLPMPATKASQICLSIEMPRIAYTLRRLSYVLQNTLKSWADLNWA